MRPEHLRSYGELASVLRELCVHENIEEDGSLAGYTKRVTSILNEETSPELLSLGFAALVSNGVWNTPWCLDEVIRDAERQSGNLGKIVVFLDSGEGNMHPDDIRSDAFMLLYKLWRESIWLSFQLTCMHSVRNHVSSQIQDSFDSVDQRLKEVDIAMNNAADDVRKLQERSSLSHVGVLGIFASVALIVNAGISFSGAAVEASAGMSFTNIVFVVALMGFVVLNATALLVMFLWKVIKEQAPFSRGAILIWIVTNILLITGSAVSIALCR